MASSDDGDGGGDGVSYDFCIHSVRASQFFQTGYVSGHGVSYAGNFYPRPGAHRDRAASVLPCELRVYKHGAAWMDAICPCNETSFFPTAEL